jgi:hypothetical protein
MPSRLIRFTCALLALFLSIGALSGCAALSSDPAASPSSAPSPSVQAAQSAAAPPVAPALMISEIMADNETYFLQGFADWVEVFNPSDEAAELSDYYIARDEFHPYECRLPEGTLEPGEFRVLPCGRDISFNLAKEGGVLVLTTADGNRSDLLEYPALAPDESCAADGVHSAATPGFANTEDGHAQYRATLPKELVINEVLSKNSGAYALDNALPDAIELANLSDAPVELSDYYLSDTQDDFYLFHLPAYTLEPGEVFVVVADGGASAGGAPFKVSAEGEALYLVRTDGAFSDALFVPALKANVSYGRAGDSFAYFQPPGIGEANAAGRTEPLEAPQSSLAPGAYGGTVEVTLSGEGEIYYTVNGAEPTKTRGTLYDGAPIPIASTCALRARAYAGEAASASVTFNYFIGEPDYAMPILKITAPPGTVTGSGGIYENYTGSREVEINLAFFENGAQSFSIDCGVSMFGAGSRVLAKKSFKVKFRKIYGNGTLEYAMFDGLGIASFDALVLRCGSEDQGRAFFRDELMTSLVGLSDMDTLYVQAYRPVNLYINEEYFGIYYVREWVRESYVATHMNVSEDSVSIIEGWDYAIRGSGDTWFELLDYCRRNGDLSDDAKCAWVLERIDEQSLMDYYIARAYGGDHDWANIRHIRSSGGDGKWRVVFFDLDWAFMPNSSEHPFYDLLGERKNLRGHNNVVMRALLTNASFRARFLARVGHELSTAFAAENVLARIDAMEREIEADMPYECARWHRNVDDWRAQVQKLRDFTADRAGILAADAITTFDMTEEEVVLYFAGIDGIKP